MKHQVVCTGIGLITSLGYDNDQVFDRLFSGTSGIRLLPPEISNNIKTVAGAIDFDPSPWLTKMDMSGMDRISQMAVAAADLAVKNAKIEITPQLQVGCHLGTGMGGAGSLQNAFQGHFSPRPKIHPLAVVSSMTNAAAAHVAMRFNIRGPVITYSVACASSAIAIGEASQAIAAGRLDCAVVGGCESLLVSGVIQAWQSMRTLATPDEHHPEASCRPFSLNRSGLVLAEGAAFLVLERADLAKARGATVFAEIAGYGVSCDANHIAIPNKEGQALALRAALKDAGVKTADVGYINAHGTATRAGDTVEAASIEEVWGADLAGLKVTSTKSMHGHLLGAAGALESALTILSLHRGQILPTAFCNQLDPEIKVPMVLDKGINAPDLKVAINNSFAFGGTNAVLVFKRSGQ